MQAKTFEVIACVVSHMLRVEASTPLFSRCVDVVSADPCKVYRNTDTKN